MTGKTSCDAVVVGSGPNGLAAAITLAQAGRSVLVLEAQSTIGGGARSAELTLPGFIHDTGSAVHPLGVSAPFFVSLPLDEHGLQWIYPPSQLAHPLDDGTAVMLERSIRATGEGLYQDAETYWKVMAYITRRWEWIADIFLGPLRIPKHIVAPCIFGVGAIWPARLFAETLFRNERTRALFAGIAAHSFLPLEQAPSAAFGLFLGMLGHAVGWPIPQGGAQQISNALASYLRSLGGEIITNERVEDVDHLPAARAVLFDVTPRQLISIAGKRFPEGYNRALARYRDGPGTFKVDLALDGPIPWKAPECLRAGTIHVGGTLAEVSDSERSIWRNEHCEQPFVLVAQPSLFDSTRAPEGKHTVWAYCHIPNGSPVDMTERIESQIERFAPGFRDRIIGRSVMGPVELERYNANHRGGDISGGIQDFAQLFTRPTISLNPYATPAKGIYLCSSSTPPGGGVHGMCGYYAAQAALRDVLR
ncbi:MAG: NAD(P)/FAD-dependent oxidoreductase [Chloroflexi bacterium AL-W]|nr:NAD(P)/FAD-dependent oxidoreductase [Chloroflexi bacterium AL-N1]NOK65147.1 NAD(P)/FAD-dependent oxidoreductase [Chloroflexi bacterium AL-N10]NOK72586.1 NAD(P)/FAD-dependent oxidoreductase [Chloroflexi bacterium AL-N5]NOK79326.1 NAD(P)/FAD-dependent oxidoreductase [Chloroflexi bacterium AL-W]NOK87242.1 NAD(P)/FAD-dependent oxidoreductase [Chloroflexi bacterium AL-N15]